MAKAIHSMIRVKDRKKSVNFYEEAFGLSVADTFDFENFTLIYLSNEETEFEVELTVNKAQSGPYDLGDGYGHIAFSVQDIHAEHERLSALGFLPGDVKSLDHDGKKLATFFFLEDPDGYKIEILQRAGRYI
ncbi:VOC family protein [Falsihalocynthiibacter sp. S25ZX9]|uniref:VOC family protein n=1 Tax=Falsihalocynthiibacter sp. S25ZX9 TaxID=3240870 RepID=UPI00350EB3FC